MWKSALARCVAAVLLTAVALLVRWALNPVLGSYVPYITLFPAVAFAAWYCGVLASAASILVALAGAQYFIISGTHSLRPSSLPEWLGVLAFAVAGALLVALGTVRQRREELLRSAHDALEVRVAERTRELDRATQSLRELTARLLQLQDDERRRIARELHDSVGQVVAALSMNLATIGGDLQRLANTVRTVSDSEALVQEMSKEIRTISHLLHPPLLDEAGLASALRWYADGFSARSQIKVDLDLPDDFGRLPRELETAVFRMVQECLTNIHRHAESPTAKVRIARSARHVTVEVTDHGKGIPAEKQEELAATGAPGVGIRGMRERLRQLGGTLEIHSDGNGTLITARLPLTRPASLSADAA